MELRNIKGFSSYLRAVVLRPLWALLTESALFGALAWLTWARDNLMPEEAEKRYATLRFLPHWPWQSWIAVFLGVTVVLLLRNSYALWNEDHQETERHRREIHGPELVIKYGDAQSALPKEGDTTIFGNPLVIRNLSVDRNAYNVSVKELVTSDGRATFDPKVISCIGAGGYASVSPHVADTGPLFRERLILLCYKRRTQQKGQQGSRLSRNLASLIRSVAMEYGLCRSGRMRRPPGPEVGRKFLGA
jgi:hypothetical protein